MTYLSFHLVFILPPLLLLAVPARRAAHCFGSRGAWTLPVMALIALIWTTPWDNYLVYRGVWWYGVDRVVGTIGYVPVEEYLFFVLQPLLAGAWTYVVLARAGLPPAVRSRPRPGSVPGADARGLGVALYLLAAAAGALALTFRAGLYLGLILVWSAPVLAAQWFFIAHAVARAPATFALCVVPPTLYLWVADRFAIGAGIWSIAPQYTIGFVPFGLPFEEAVFFLVTNLLVVQGVLLFLLPVSGSRPTHVAEAHGIRAVATGA
jgi:lycopene beta-cyclase